MRSTITGFLFVQNVIRDYPWDITYQGQYDVTSERKCGISQGSILELLWNFNYDWMLWSVLPMGLSIICYKNDTLVVTCGEDLKEALPGEGGLVVSRIRMLGLEMTLHKSCDSEPQRKLLQSHIKVRRIHIEILWYEILVVLPR